MAVSWEPEVPVAEKPNSQPQAKVVHSRVKALMPIKRKCFCKLPSSGKEYNQALNMCTKTVEIEAIEGGAQKQRKKIKITFGDVMQNLGMLLVGLSPGSVSI